MAHFPKPFFKQARQLWYVEIDRKQVCLGPDKDEAFLKYHALMQARRRGELSQAVAGSNPLVAVLADAYLQQPATDHDDRLDLGLEGDFADVGLHAA